MVLGRSKNPLKAKNLQKKVKEKKIYLKKVILQKIYGLFLSYSFNNKDNISCNI